MIWPQNELMKSSFLPKYEQKIVKIFLFVFWENRWLHKFILKITDLYGLKALVQQEPFTHFLYFTYFACNKFYSRIVIPIFQGWKFTHLKTYDFSTFNLTQNPSLLRFTVCCQYFFFFLFKSLGQKWKKIISIVFWFIWEQGNLLQIFPDL